MNIPFIVLAGNGSVPQVTRGDVSGDSVWRYFQKENMRLNFCWIFWMALRRISDSVQSWRFLCWIHDNAIRTSEGSGAFCILDCRRVQQSTLLCSPKARHRCHCFGVGVFFFFPFYNRLVFVFILVADWFSWKTCSESSFFCRTFLMVMAFKCQCIPITLGLLWVCWHSKIIHIHTHTHIPPRRLRKQFFSSFPPLTTRNFKVSFVLLWMHHWLFQKLSWMFGRNSINCKGDYRICVLLPDESA